MGVSLGVYRARIGLFSLRFARDSNYSSHRMYNATHLAWLSKSPWLLVTTACMFLSDIGNIILVWFFIIVMILTCSGDIEANPGPGPRTSSQGRYFTFCHANMRSIKKCPEKLDHIRAEFRGTYDVITISETWLSPDNNLDQYGRPLYNIEGYHDPVRRDRRDRRGGGVLAWVSETGFQAHA